MDLSSITSENSSKMAPAAEPRNVDIAGGGGCEDGAGDTSGSEAYSDVVAGDEYVTSTLTSTSTSLADSSKYVTARMSDLQIKAAIETSREQGYWSELVDSAGDGAGTASAGRGVDDQRVWEELKDGGGIDFMDLGDQVKLGRVIGEGAQAITYEATWGTSESFVAKVFKMEGFSLADLQRQWPLVTEHDEHGNPVKQRAVFSRRMDNCCSIYFGTLLKDGRFAFLMWRFWGDLRTLINLKWIRTDSRGPAFLQHESLKIIWDIANVMMSLHGRGVPHKGLKAANVLVHAFRSGPNSEYPYTCHVADYESSMFIQGTGFWRAPEVLEQLLKKPCDREDMNKKCTKEGDVYSYAMTCYEVLTGHTPFFGMGSVLEESH